MKGICDQYENNKGLRELCFDVFRHLDKKKVLMKEKEDLKDKMSCVLSYFIV